VSNHGGTPEGFVMDAATATEFFELCIQLELNTYEERMTLLREFVRAKKAGYVAHPFELLRGKKVLDLRKYYPHE